MALTPRSSCGTDTGPVAMSLLSRSKTQHQTPPSFTAQGTLTALTPLSSPSTATGTPLGLPSTHQTPPSFSPQGQLTGPRPPTTADAATGTE
jgi:hypothetical protein